MVTHHTASLITANARAWFHAVARESRRVVSLIAVMDHRSALVPAFRSPVCSRFHAARQDGEQNRACSRRGTNEVPHCSQVRDSATTVALHGHHCCPPRRIAGAALPVSAIGAGNESPCLAVPCPAWNRRLHPYQLSVNA